MIEKILTKNVHLPNSHTIEAYIRQGGYLSIRKAFKMKPDEVTDEVMKASLRGRGGAGFPAGRKWRFVPKDTGNPKYLTVNADEGEPGTYKDRLILEKNPHALIEGILICCYAVGIHACYIYIRGEFFRQKEILDQAIKEAYQRGLLGKNILGSGFDLECYSHAGAGAYICGEETGLLESLEGKPGRPRPKPPFPAVEGAFRCPTVVNNVETISYLPSIIEMGGEKFCKLGKEKDGGLKLYCISGHVKKPGIFELPMGTSLYEIIYAHCGGILDDKPLKAVIPGGSSTPVLTAGEIDVTMDFDSMAKAGSMLGSAATIVVAEGTCMVEFTARLAKFYSHESCGQCTPCREGTTWLYKLIKEIEAGRGREGDIEKMLEVCKGMLGTTICVLSDACAMPVESILNKFRSEFEAHIRQGTCPFKSSSENQ
jgi:NADH-quinone oxidoreductase subunit F